MNLGEHIYRLRTERNLSQGDFADALDFIKNAKSLVILHGPSRTPAPTLTSHHSPIH